MVFQYSSLNAGPGPDPAPGCYLDSALAFEKGEIPLDEFFRRCLQHLGTSEKPSHEVHDVRDGQWYLLWKYYHTYGPVAAAIRLCGYDPRARSTDGKKLVPILMACTSKDSNIDSIRAISASNFEADAETVLATPLIRQVLMVTAIQSEHWSLAEELIQIDCPPPPPEDKCVFTMRGSALCEMVRDTDIPARVWTALIKARWVPGTFSLAIVGSQCPSTEEGIALLEAAQAAGLDLKDRKSGYGERMHDFALERGHPDTVKYLRKLCSITKPLQNHILPRAVEKRESGGVEMLKWLLDEQKLYINWMGASDPNGYANYDPRERAEQEWYNAKSALHWAAHKGNTDAVRFLLERGADPTVRDAVARTPRKLAEGAGNTAVVEIFDEFERQKDPGFLSKIFG
ncbi:uncharacterized protein F4822DRAFT_343958 [Hypoxylon trugodes]|uniref:uncharacterized protein n=1 Tax=Hypoxylon trugodes TaxID=326681 RepID=UPI00218F647A|nr:uncharacterized protein F4822DRAFT_343958 [Hypoxylon trugodes]KAI1385430.1 hypothetical protein F4822DRAFT_343958 [Hypoxylon trugodes]